MDLAATQNFRVADERHNLCRSDGIKAESLRSEVDDLVLLLFGVEKVANNTMIFEKQSPLVLVPILPPPPPPKVKGALYPGYHLVQGCAPPYLSNNIEEWGCRLHQFRTWIRRWVGVRRVRSKQLLVRWEMVNSWWLPQLNTFYRLTILEDVIIFWSSLQSITLPLTKCFKKCGKVCWKLAEPCTKRKTGGGEFQACWWRTRRRRGDRLFHTTYCRDSC